MIRSKKFDASTEFASVLAHTSILISLSSGYNAIPLFLKTRNNVTYIVD